MAWFANALNAPDFANLASLIYIGTAEFDPLRDEAEAYAKKAQDAGNNVVLRRFQGVPHQFMHMDAVLLQGREYIQDVIANVRRCLYPAPTHDKPSTESNSTSQATPASGVAVTPKQEAR